MTVDRRFLLKGGLAAGAGFAFAMGGAEASGPTAQDRGAEARIVEAALRLVKANVQRITHTDRAALVDFSLPSWKPRLHLVDFDSGKVSSYLVAHGRGSDPKHTGWLQQFSNEIGSYATSDGAYRTGAVYEGKYGTSMRLAGLDDDNSNARTRAIVIHAAWYAGPEMLAKYGKLGRSEGCFSLSEKDRTEVVAKLGEGRLLYAGKF